MILFFLCLTQQVTRLEAVRAPRFDALVFSEGYFCDGWLFPGEKALHRWDRRGRLVLSIPHNQQIKRGYYLQHAKVYLLANAREKTVSSYNEKGEQIGEQSIRLGSFQETGGIFFSSTNAHLEYAQEYPFAFLAVGYIWNAEENRLDPVGLEFCKTTQRMLDLELNFKRIWIEAIGDVFYIVDQLEPQVRIYTPQMISREKLETELQPSPAPSLHLNLPRFTGMPDNFFTLDKPSWYTEGQPRLYDWWNSLGLITHFGRLGDGWVIAYQIPEYEDGKPVGWHLGIQPLFRDFKNRGLLIEIQDKMSFEEPESMYQVVGTEGSDLFVFYPRPDGNGGMSPEVHTYSIPLDPQPAGLKPPVDEPPEKRPVTIAEVDRIIRRGQMIKFGGWVLVFILSSLTLWGWKTGRIR